MSPPCGAAQLARRLASEILRSRPVATSWIHSCSDPNSPRVYARTAHRETAWGRSAPRWRRQDAAGCRRGELRPGRSGQRRSSPGYRWPTPQTRASPGCSTRGRSPRRGRLSAVGHPDRTAHPRPGRHAPTRGDPSSGTAARFLPPRGPERSRSKGRGRWVASHRHRRGR